MSTKTFRVGMVGAGNIAEFHVAAVKKLAPDVELVGICDLDAERARTHAEKWGTTAHADLDALVAAGANVIHVLTPPAAHAAVARAALEKGCHVLIEKPIAEDISEARAIGELAKKRGLVATVNHSLLYDPQVLRALDPKAGNPKLKSVMGAFAMPSHVAGRTMPAFLGGSDLAIPITTSHKSQAEDWLADFTSSANMAGIVKVGNIPNNTSQLNLVSGNPGTQLARASTNTWFVPTAKNWANVENANVLRNMLTQILTNKLTVKQAAEAASDTITSILNAPS